MRKMSTIKDVYWIHRYLDVFGYHISYINYHIVSVMVKRDDNSKDSDICAAKLRPSQYNRLLKREGVEDYRSLRERKVEVVLAGNNKCKIII